MLPHRTADQKYTDKSSESNASSNHISPFMFQIVIWIKHEAPSPKEMKQCER